MVTIREYQTDIEPAENFGSRGRGASRLVGYLTALGLAFSGCFDSGSTTKTQDDYRKAPALVSSVSESSPSTRREKTPSPVSTASTASATSYSSDPFVERAKDLFKRHVDGMIESRREFYKKIDQIGENFVNSRSELALGYIAAINSSQQTTEKTKQKELVYRTGKILK